MKKELQTGLLWLLFELVFNREDEIQGPAEKPDDF